MLFGVYGDVQRVKILFHKKSTALIQMSEHQQCDTAIKHLDRILSLDYFLKNNSILNILSACQPCLKQMLNSHSKVV